MQILQKNTNLRLGCVGYPSDELVGVGVVQVGESVDGPR